jgi:hypothetical protein
VSDLETLKQARALLDDERWRFFPGALADLDAEAGDFDPQLYCALGALSAATMDLPMGIGRRFLDVLAVWIRRIPEILVMIAREGPW